MAQPTINTREDLEAVAGTPVHAAFLENLRASMTHRQDVQTYPEGYGTPDYDGPVIEPIWQDVEDLNVIARFGFAKSELKVHAPSKPKGE